RQAIAGLSVDVAEQTAQPPMILRGGNQVIPPVVDDQKVSSFIVQLVPIDRFDVPRVLSQSVPANTRVIAGTAIDLVLVPVNNIHLGLLDGTHPDLANKLVSDLLPIVQTPAVAAILQKTTDPMQVSDADKQTIEAQVTQ